MPKYTVDGSFFVQQISGIQRYAREIFAAMDPMLEPGELEVAVPPDCIVPEYRNIKVVTLPQSSGILGCSGCMADIWHKAGAAGWACATLFPCSTVGTRHCRGA